MNTPFRKSLCTSLLSDERVFLVEEHLEICCTKLFLLLFTAALVAEPDSRPTVHQNDKPVNALLTKLILSNSAFQFFN